MIYITARHMEGGSGHEHIASVQWIQPGTTTTGTSTRAEMVTWIDTMNGDARVRGIPDSQVGTVDGNPRYLRSFADNTWNNNLLSLPVF